MSSSDKWGTIKNKRKPVLNDNLKQNSVNFHFIYMINYNQNSIKSNYIIGKLLSVGLIILPRIVKDLEWNSVRVPSNCTRMPSNDFESDKHGKWCFLFARNNGSPRNEMGGAIQYPSLVSTSNRAVQMTAIYCEGYSLACRNITAPCNLSTFRKNKIRESGKCKPDLLYPISMLALDIKILWISIDRKSVV